jgi:hypothetical protein
LWKVSPDLSLFGRTSKGGRFNSDRQTVSGKFNADGSLCTRAQATALACTDGVTPSVDFVTQHEIGVKNRGSIGGGRYSVEFTLLKGDFKRSDFEPTVPPASARAAAASSTTASRPRVRNSSQR